MKIRDGFLLRRMLGMGVVVPVGAAETEGVITLNETGVFLWEALEKGADSPEGLARALAEVYDVEEAAALRDVTAFLATAREANLLAE